MDRPRAGADLDRVGGDLNVLADETVDEVKLMMGVTRTCSVGRRCAAFSGEVHEVTVAPSDALPPP